MVKNLTLVLATLFFSPLSTNSTCVTTCLYISCMILCMHLYGYNVLASKLLVVQVIITTFDDLEIVCMLLLCLCILMLLLYFLIINVMFNSAPKERSKVTSLKALIIGMLEKYDIPVSSTWLEIPLVSTPLATDFPAW